MASADPIPNLTGLSKAAQLDALRKRMATIPGRRDHAPTDLPGLGLAPFPVQGPQVVEAQESAVDEPKTTTLLGGAARSQTLRTIPTPLPITELLPRGALARGTALSVSGAGSVLVGFIAAASAAGHHVAIIGQPKVGLLAVHEHGGDLSRVAVVDPGDGDTALEVASICLDGLDVIVTTLGGRDIPPTRARALLARCRSHASVLVTTDGHMPGLDLTIDSRPVDIGGIEQGRGRVRSITIETTVHGRATPQRTGRYTLGAEPFSKHGPTWTPAPATPRETRRPLAAAQ